MERPSVLCLPHKDASIEMTATAVASTRFELRGARELARRIFLGVGSSTFGRAPQRRAGFRTRRLHDCGFAVARAGNRLTRSASGSLANYTSNAADQLTLVQPASGAPTTLSYDLNGNLTLEKAGTVVDSYTWDPENRLSVWNSGAYSQLQTFSYDPSGLRVRRVLPTRTDNLLNDDQNLAEVVTGDPVVYQHLPGVWGAVFSNRFSGATRFYVPDFQGHSRLYLNSSQAIVGTALYDAWGAEILNPGGIKLDFSAYGAWGYFRDSPTRSYARAREVRRDWGRWLSVDPIGFEGGDWNPFLYVSNDPVTAIDPSGTIVITPTKLDW